MKPRWYILGAGAMGCLWAYQLRAEGFPVTLLFRNEEKLAQLGKKGLTYSATWREGLPSYNISVEGELIGESSKPIQQLLITTKAHQTEEAYQSILPRIKSDSRIVLLQNGLGVFEKLIALYPTKNFFNASTTEGAYIQDDFHVIHAGKGKTWVGTLLPYISPSESGAVMDMLKQLDFDIEWTKELEVKLWQKLAANAIINPLTVIFNCKNGELLTNPAAIEVIKKLSHEIEALLMVKTISNPNPNLYEFIIKILDKTANNYSSMWQDVHHGRDTEWEFINGYISIESERLKLPCPTNDAIIRRLQQTISAKRAAASTTKSQES